MMRTPIGHSEHCRNDQRRRVQNQRQARDSSGGRRLVFRRLFNCRQRSFDRLRLCLSGQKIHQHYGRIQITNHGEQLVVLTMAFDPFPPPQKVDPAFGRDSLDDRFQVAFAVRES